MTSSKKNILKFMKSFEELILLSLIKKHFNSSYYCFDHLFFILPYAKYIFADCGSALFFHDKLQVCKDYRQRYCWINFLLTWLQFWLATLLTQVVRMRKCISLIEGDDAWFASRLKIRE